MDVLELMNTIWADRQGVHDSLADGSKQLRELRDALRRLAAVRTGDPREKGAPAGMDVHTAIQMVNRYAAPTRPVLELVDGALTTTLHTASNPDERLLGTIAAEAVEFFGHDMGLRACLAPGCVRYFLKDHPRREWCSAGCGNRARAARHYARHGRTTTTDRCG